MISPVIGVSCRCCTHRQDTHLRPFDPRFFVLIPPLLISR